MCMKWAFIFVQKGNVNLISEKSIIILIPPLKVLLKYFRIQFNILNMKN